MLQSLPIFARDTLHPSCHAATIAEVGEHRFVAAWFGGAYEGHPDVAIWLAHYVGSQWGQPVKVADEPDVPLWNPVLFRDAGDTLWLFYKVAPTIPAWTGAYLKSTDGGQTWSLPTILPAGLLGPAKNKPVALSNGDILSGTSAETWRSWTCWVEISSDGGATWTKHGPLAAPGFHSNDVTDNPVASATWDAASHELVLPQNHAGVIQPAVWEYTPGRLKMLMRSTRRVGAVCAATSDDYGRTWSPVQVLDIPHSNTGLDAVQLKDGRIALVCTPAKEGRTPLSLLVSEDNGVTWPVRKDLETEPGEYSYPSVIQASDGQIHIVYTYRREHIQHVVLDPDHLT